MFKIYPIHVATLKDVDQSNTTYLKGAGIKHDLSCVAWILKSDQSTYIVDPGPGQDVDRILRLHTIKKMDLNESLLGALDEQRIPRSEIKAVINTHLHWDHCLANDEFPHFPIIVQRQEFEYAQNPLKINVLFYESNHGDAPVYRYKDRMQFVEGDTLLEEGLELIFTPGHTPGHQSVKVTTEQGDYILAGDQFDLYENYENQHPIGIHVNLFDWYASLHKVQAMNANVLPSHDPLVLSKKVYG